MASERIVQEETKPVPIKQIAEAVVELVVTAKTAGCEQETIRQALMAFATAAQASTR